MENMGIAINASERNRDTKRQGKEVASFLDTPFEVGI
jgi:hypothetical protein